MVIIELPCGRLICLLDTFWVHIKLSWAISGAVFYAKLSAVYIEMKQIIYDELNDCDSFMVVLFGPPCTTVATIRKYTTMDTEIYYLYMFCTYLLTYLIL